jgi:tetratricopeptide (TPR) repeat protein
LRQNIFEILGLHRDDPEASIGKILDASIARLTPKLQELLFNLSVYRPAFNATAAAALLPEQEVTQADLRGLVKRSLLQENKIESGWIFEFQPLILAYLKQQAGDLTEVHERGIAYYQSIAKESWQTIKDITPQLEIFHHHCELRQYNQACKILYYCYNFLNFRGYYTTIIELSSRLEKEWQPSNEDESREFAYVLTFLGNAYNSLAQYQKAIDYYQQSLAIYLEIGDRNGEANFLFGLGNTYNSLGEYQQAIDFYQQLLTIQREIGDRNGEATSLQNLAQLYHLTGRIKEGYAAAFQAPQILQKLELPIEAWAIPKWQKSLAKFAQRGKLQLCLCFLLGLFAFPFALVFIVSLMLWRVIKSQLRR